MSLGVCLSEFWFYQDLGCDNTMEAHFGYANCKSFGFTFECINGVKMKSYPLDQNTASKLADNNSSERNCFIDPHEKDCAALWLPDHSVIIGHCFIENDDVFGSSTLSELSVLV